MRQVARNLDVRVVGSLHIAALFGAIIEISIKVEAMMTMNAAVYLVAGVALLRRSGDGSEIRRDRVWKAYNS